MRLLPLAVAALLAASGAALADPITGSWRTEAGPTAQIAACGGSFCIEMTSGQYSGRSIGKLSATGSGYAGTITDPSNNKTYDGNAALAGKTLKLSGCVLGGLICRSQTWTKL